MLMRFESDNTLLLTFMKPVSLEVFLIVDLRYLMLCSEPVVCSVHDGKSHLIF